MTPLKNLLVIDDEENMRHLLQTLLEKEGYAVTTNVQMNHVIDTIIKLATADHSELLVVGSRGLTGMERLQLGSVSESLLKYAPCSVLIVRGARA